MKTLIVEDESVVRILVQRTLGPYGRCDVASNGQEALALFKTARAEGAPYDLVCMDIMMPKMNGQDSLHAMRDAEEADGVLSTDGAKVIMLTALSDVSTIFKSFNELCDSYLVKPFDTEHLISQIKKFGLI